jgi:hypothetical protein
VVEAERLDPDQDLIRGGNRIGSSEMASTSGPPYSVTMMARMMTFLLAHCFWLFDQNQAVNKRGLLAASAAPLKVGEGRAHDRLEHPRPGPVLPTTISPIPVAISSVALAAGSTWAPISMAELTIRQHHG